MTNKYNGCLSPKLIEVGISVTPDVLTLDPVKGEFVKANKAKQYILADCGKCINCLMRRARQKAARFNIEYMKYPDAYICHVTYTYAGNPPPSRVRLPSSGPLRQKLGADARYYYPAYEDIKKMHKRMRFDGWDFSFLACEEVGDEGRLHHHVIYIFKNPEIIPDWSMAEWTKQIKANVKTRQHRLDYIHDVCADVVSYEKVGDSNKTYPPSNWLKVFRFLIRFKYWKKGIITATQSQHIGGVVNYLTSYALQYAVKYSKEKNLPAPVWRSSRLGKDWYKKEECNIRSGLVRTLPLGNGYSISMPKYRLKKFRDPYDRLQDYFRSMSQVFADKSPYCKTGTYSDIVSRNRASLLAVESAVFDLMDMPDFDDIPLEVFYKTYNKTINNILNSKHYD